MAMWLYCVLALHLPGSAEDQVELGEWEGRNTTQASPAWLFVGKQQQQTKQNKKSLELVSS